MESVPEKCIQVHRCPVGDPSSCVTNEVCTGRTTERVCGMERVSHSGSHEVEYYYSIATESIEINLSNQPLAKASASDAKSDKHYNYEGVCR